MNKISGIFCDSGEFSWRKIMTAGALVCFMTASLGYLITNSFAELPGTYQAIISGVFAFYFMKSFFRNTSLTTIEQTNGNEILNNTKKIKNEQNKTTETRSTK